MIYVEAYGKYDFRVKLKRPVSEHTERMRQIPGARFMNRDLGWRVPLSSFDDFEDLFWDEVIYITPRHVLLSEKPPKAPKFYGQIPMTPVPEITKTLYPFQVFGAHFLAYIAKNYGFGFITDKMGLGKTPQGIAGAQLLKEEGLVKRVLVVVLASLRKQWIREGIQFFTNESALAVDGDLNKRKKLYQESLDKNIMYTVISYNGMLSDLDILKKGKFDLVIFDEAHLLKNKMGKMNRAAEKLMKPVKSRKYRGIPYCFFLTGTPLMNRLEELYALFKLKDRDVFGTFEDFCEDFMKCRYTERRGRRIRLDTIGYQHLSELRKIIRWYMLRRTEHEVKLDLPAMIEKWHYSEMNGLQKKLEALTKEEDTSTEEKKQGIHGIRQAIADHPRMLTQSKSKRVLKTYGSLVAQAKGNVTCPKFEDLLDFVDEIVDGGDKVVIFTEFSRMLNIIADAMDAKLIDCVVYHGGMDDEEKEEAKMAFRDDPDVKVLIGTNAASTGLNLQVAGYLINYDLPWNPAIYGQRNYRIKRIGSKHKTVTIINMLTEGSIDEEKRKIIEDKQNLFDATVENDEGQTEALRKILN